MPVKFILLGTAAVFVLMLLVTSIGFHRILTSELMIIHAWVALELSAAASSQIGMVPLLMGAVVTAVFLGEMAVSK